jgi:hypothetical protein
MDEMGISTGRVTSPVPFPSFDYAASPLRSGQAWEAPFGDREAFRSRAEEG